MINRAQLQLDYFQHQTSTSKLYSNFPCRYAYNTSAKKTVACNEYEAQKSVWKTWLTKSSAFYPVHSSISYAYVIKNDVVKSNIQQIVPLVAVQERSQQGKPPELVKEIADNTHKAHLKVGKGFRFVGKPIVSHSSSVSVPCFNRFDPLSDCEENVYDYDTLTDVNENVIDSVCTVAAQGSESDELVKPSLIIDKSDKFDNRLVNKSMDYDTIRQVKAC